MSFDTIPLKRVAKIRNSNVDKLISDDEIPVRLCNYVDVYYNDSITPALNLSVGSATKIEIERFHLKEGDVVITKDSETPSDIAIPAIVRKSDPKLICGYHLAILKAAPDKLKGAYLFYALKSKPLAAYFETSAQGITRYGLTINGIGMAPMPIPPLPTQRTIADFLDRETARIDQLIQKKQRLVELLEEGFESIKSRAVTRGLNSSAEFKRTSSIYLPEIPAHWSLPRLKNIASVRGGLALGRSIPTGTLTRSLPYLRVANVQAGFVDITEMAEVEITEQEARRYALRAGNVLMNEGGDNDKLGRGAVWRGEISPCLHQNHVFVVRPLDPVMADWISLVSNAKHGREFTYLNSKQSTNLASISKSKISQLPIPIPPAHERSKIEKYLHQKGSTIVGLSSKTNASIDCLREFRSALITAAVTGQIDVDEWSRRGGTDAKLDAIAQEMEARTG